MFSSFGYWLRFWCPQKRKKGQPISIDRLAPGLWFVADQLRLPLCPSQYFSPPFFQPRFETVLVSVVQKIRRDEIRT